LYVSLTGDDQRLLRRLRLPRGAGQGVHRRFFHTGTKSTFRHRTHGHPIDTFRTPTWRLVVCWDNHDQIGNRAGRRAAVHQDHPAQQAIGAMVTLLSPFTPMIFMGEEWGRRRPGASSARTPNRNSPS
jgi:maltooligosyltrehalose trehalohydrolase